MSKIFVDTIEPKTASGAINIKSGGIDRPAFSMNIGGNASANSVIVLNAGFNQGNHVNTSTGVFTAPIAGLYYFTAYSIKGNVNNVVCRLQLRKSNSIIAEARMDETGNYTQACFSVIENLVVGDQITFYNGDSYAFYMDGIYGRCSGYFIG